MEYLLSKGADPNRQTNESSDPVLCAVAWFVECVRLLLQAGADLNALVIGTAETALRLWPSATATVRRTPVPHSVQQRRKLPTPRGLPRGKLFCKANS